MVNFNLLLRIDHLFIVPGQRLRQYLPYRRAVRRRLSQLGAENSIYLVREGGDEYLHVSWSAAANDCYKLTLALGILFPPCCADVSILWLFLASNDKIHLKPPWQWKSTLNRFPIWTKSWRNHGCMWIYINSGSRYTIASKEKADHPVVDREMGLSIC